MLNTKIINKYENTKSGYIKLYLDNGKVVEEHRYVMANYLGRELLYNEVIHHKDGNKKHNEISNLELKSRKDHAQNHGYKTDEEKYISLNCSYCGNSFKIERRNYKWKQSIGQINFFCCRSCQADYRRKS